MSRAFVVRYEMRPDTAADNQALVEEVFADLARSEPEGLRYAAFRLADGVSFVHVGIVSGDGDPLRESAAFQEFQRTFADRAAGPPVPSGAELIGSYRFLAD